MAVRLTPGTTLFENNCLIYNAKELETMVPIIPQYVDCKKIYIDLPGHSSTVLQCMYFPSSGVSMLCMGGHSRQYYGCGIVSTGSAISQWG